MLIADSGRTDLERREPWIPALHSKDSNKAHYRGLKEAAASRIESLNGNTGDASSAAGPQDVGARFFDDFDLEFAYHHLPPALY